MSLELLRQIASSPLPQSFTAADDIDAVRVLRQAGLVLALVDDPPERGARVLAITEKGNRELLQFHYPEAGRKQGKPKARWLEIAAARAREALLAPRRRDGR